MLPVFHDECLADGTPLTCDIRNRTTQTGATAGNRRGHKRSLLT